jgi:hypothetical protein
VFHVKQGGSRSFAVDGYSPRTGDIAQVPLGILAASAERPVRQEFGDGGVMLFHVKQRASYFYLEPRFRFVGWGGGASPKRAAKKSIDTSSPRGRMICLDRRLQ